MKNHYIDKDRDRRVEWIDIAKGLGILTVILGHSGFPDVIQWWIWSFHMPLFFLISGVLYSKDKYPTFVSLIKKRNRNLIVPYVFFSILTLLGYYYLEPSTIVARVRDVFMYGWGGIALWFIPVLYLTELSFFFLRKYLSELSLLVSLIGISILGYALSLNNIHFPYKAEVVLTALFFYGIGNITKTKLANSLNTLSIDKAFIYSSLFLATNVLFCFLNYTRLDLCFNIIGNYAFAYISAFAGILFIFIVARLVSNLKILETFSVKRILAFLGTNTFILLSIHQIIMLILIDIFADLPVSKNASSLLRHPILWAVMILSIFVINKYLPFILGKGSKKVSEKATLVKVVKV